MTNLESRGVAMKPRAKMVERGVVYEVDGTVKPVTPVNGKKFTMSELQFHVGGFVEQLISADRAVRLFVDEEGACKKLPPNPHTWSLVHQNVYVLNGYSRVTWRVSGPILAISKEAFHD